jgi:hypothetical protein
LKIQHRYGPVGRFTLHVAEVGTGELVLLFRGFRTCWQDWTAQLGALAASGQQLAERLLFIRSA